VSLRGNPKPEEELANNIHRGPEVETWFGAEEGTDPAVDNEWSLLPFMALSDGAHT
jgi:hypothetical protein